jgi:hypothetical protein
VSSLCARWAIALAALSLAPAVHAGEPGGLGGGEDLSVPIVRILFAFLFCAGLAFLVVLVLRKRGAGGSLSLFKLPTKARRIEVIETRRLSPHADVSLIREGGDEYLVLLFAGGCEVLRSGAIDKSGEEP